MRETFLPYNLPDIGTEEMDAVLDVIRSRWITRGHVTEEFEAALQAYLGVPAVVAVSSCTAALHLALVAAGIGPGDDVITTPYTFVASVNAILYAGARPVLVDIEPDTGNLNPELVSRAMTSRTRAVLPVHYGGHAVNMPAINQIRDRFGLTVIEDAAHGLASTVQGRLVGQWGNLTAFSFYATKNLATGEGGALAVPDASLAEHIRVLALHGMSKNAWNRYTQQGHWGYDVGVLGYKYNMTDLQAALGLVQLKKLPAMQARRAQIAERYHTAFAGLPVVLPVERPDYGHAWHLYPLRLQLNELTCDRATVIEDLRQENIGTSVHFIPVHHHTYYQRRFGWKVGDYPEADRFFAAEISLPLYPSMTDDDVNDVIEAVQRVLARRVR
ncbi:MAG: DegT/DnrJ/EryC1/StrS aminotransferase family protein [Sulfobacillus sp.]|nr:DegT/DnrJ/EryC1/StrS aminotransferase family protein [Sulfobacillus sp.]